jgi:hypothetical protein
LDAEDALDVEGEELFEAAPGAVGGCELIADEGDHFGGVVGEALRLRRLDGAHEVDEVVADGEDVALGRRRGVAGDERVEVEFGVEAFEAGDPLGGVAVLEVAEGESPVLDPVDGVDDTAGRVGEDETVIGVVAAEVVQVDRLAAEVERGVVGEGDGWDG